MLVLASCVSTSIGATATGVAQLTLQSTPGDYIGGGQDWNIVYTPQNSYYFETFVNLTVGGQPAEIDFILGTVTSGTDNTFAGVSFGTNQLGIPLAPGSYPNAQRAPFAMPGFAGLDVSFQNRGCNTLTGSFVITEAVFGVDSSNNPTIRRFVASFVQNCEVFMPPLQGTFYFDASGLAPSLPDLTISKTHAGNFTQGRTGVYSLTVNNVGEGSTTGTVTVTDALPSGLIATDISGSGWNCSTGTLTCTRADTLAAGNSYPVIHVTVNVANNALPSVTNTASVSGGGEVTLVNDVASDPTVIVAPPIVPARILGQWGILLLCGLLGAVSLIRLRWI